MVIRYFTSQSACTRIKIICFLSHFTYIDEGVRRQSSFWLVIGRKKQKREKKENKTSPRHTHKYIQTLINHCRSFLSRRFTSINMSSTTTIVWLQIEQDGPVPNELRSHVALFTSEDVCYQFLCSLPSTSNNLTLVVTDPRHLTARLTDLKPISTIYLLLSGGSEPFKKTSPKIQGVFPDREALIDQIRSDLSREKAPKPGFVTGFFAPFQGLFFILSHSSTWLRALIPALVFTILLFTFSILSVWGMHLATAPLIENQASRWARFGIWLLRLVLYVVAICFSLIVALTTAQPISSPALESLVRAQERALKYPNRPEEAFCASVWRSIRIALLSLLASFAIFFVLTVVEIFVPPAVVITTPLKFITTGFVLAYDIIDYPLSLHMLGIRERTPWFRHYLWAILGFGLSMELLFLIPGAFLLLLPAGVCGATRLVVAAERASIDQPLLLQSEVIQYDK